MNRSRAFPVVVLAALCTHLACSRDGVTPVDPFDPGGPLVPVATETLALTRQMRRPIFRERLPKIDVSTVAGGIRVAVARPDFACTVTRAWVGREPGVLTVVARVWPDPAALCAGGYVIVYAGVIDGIAPGRYTVHVYEGLGLDGTPVRLGTRTVTVLAPAP